MAKKEKLEKKISKTFKVPEDVNDQLKSLLKKDGISFQDFALAVCRIFVNAHKDSNKKRRKNLEFVFEYIISIARCYPALTKKELAKAIELKLDTDETEG